MTISGKEALELTEKIMRENRERRLAEIAQAKAAAPSSKEPLDVERVKRECRVSALGTMTDEELVLKLEDLYYVDHPRYRTNQELIDLISTIADYE